MNIKEKLMNSERQWNMDKYRVTALIIMIIRHQLIKHSKE